MSTMNRTNRTKSKTEVLTVRLPRTDAERIRRLARTERRSISNMIEVMLSKATNDVNAVGTIK